VAAAYSCVIQGKYMKKFLIFICGLFCGAIITLVIIWFFLLPSFVEMALDKVHQDMAGVGVQGEEHFKLKDDQMVVITSREGKAVVDFTSFGNSDDNSYYRWRYKSYSENLEKTGKGKVFEKYNRVKKEDGYLVEDIGSELSVKAGPIILQWSYGSPKSGWFYYNSDKMKIEIFSDKKFESYDIN
jgi:hypothetical protein